ncbi:hypothetical protein CRENBAI_025852 [Crenichthys baileyi]|uniref:Uncharacterized protein n=1 Tax=Crenichthys baileyi TaxID=28760 RepID=A0AAV9SMW8_9TELE
MATGYTPFEVSLGYQPPLFPADEEEKAFSICPTSCSPVPADLSELSTEHPPRTNAMLTDVAPRLHLIAAQDIPLKSLSRKLFPRFQDQATLPPGGGPQSDLNGNRILGSVPAGSLQIRSPGPSEPCPPSNVARPG